MADSQGVFGIRDWHKEIQSDVIYSAAKFMPQNDKIKIL